LPFILVADAAVSSPDKARPEIASDTITVIVFMMDLLNQRPERYEAVRAAAHHDELLHNVVLHTVAFGNFRYKCRLKGEGYVRSGVQGGGLAVQDAALPRSPPGGFKTSA
jgi:hypothetical protein